MNFQTDAFVYFDKGYKTGRDDMKSSILELIHERINALFECDANEKQMVAVLEAKAIIDIIKGAK